MFSTVVNDQSQCSAERNHLRARKKNPKHEPLAHTYCLCNEDHTGLHLSKKVRHMLRRPASTAAPVPLWTCVAAAELTGLACLGAIRESVLRSEAPLESPDWLESHLPNGLALCHQTVEQHRGLGGVKKKRELLYDRKRRGTGVREKERKMSLPMYVRWYRLL